MHLCANQVHAHACLSRARRVGDQHASALLKDIEGLCNSQSLRWPEGGVTGQILAAQKSLCPIRFKQLSARSGYGLLPRDEAKQLFEKLDQFFVVVGSKAPKLLGNLSGL